MFTLMPYENSIVVLKMNGPQLKAVLERAYRNYYYKYVPRYGGYSYYTTCMLDIDSGGKILYRDTSPSLPDGNTHKGRGPSGLIRAKSKAGVPEMVLPSVIHDCKR